MALYIAETQEQRKPKGDILAINALAKEDQAKGNVVINASIGTFLTQEKKVGSPSLIQEALKEHITDRLGYPAPLGDKDYREGVMNYLFKEKKERIDELYHPFIGATLGGTGALFFAFSIFLKRGEKVLLPDRMWSNYKLIAKEAGLSYDTYPLFNEENQLDVKGLKEAIEKQFEEQGKSLVLLNDPCQNPTGYCLSEEEYEELFPMLEEEGKKGTLIVLFDIAYSSFYHVPGHKFVLMDKLAEKKYSFLPLLAFSGSKIFGMYGLRVGALIALCPDKENVEVLNDAFFRLSRGTYSASVGAAQAAVATILNDKEKIKELEAQIQENSDILYNRSKVLLTLCEELGLEHYPYLSGFFVSLKSKDAYQVYEGLRKEHIYVVPIEEKVIRLALSGLSEEEIKYVLPRIKKIEETL